MSEKQDVLIVGAGPTGLVMAHEFARDGIGCRIIDKSAHASTHSKAIAIHARTLEVFELMTIVDDFMAVGKQITAVDLHGERGPIAHIGFGSLATRYPYVLGVPQDETERILEERLARLASGSSAAPSSSGSPSMIPGCAPSCASASVSKRSRPPG